MTKEEFANRMKIIADVDDKLGYTWDEESAHIEADDLIIELLKSLGYEEGAQIFDDMPKWYS